MVARHQNHRRREAHSAALSFPIYHLRSTQPALHPLTCSLAFPVKHIYHGLDGLDGLTLREQVWAYLVPRTHFHASRALGWRKTIYRRKIQRLPKSNSLLLYNKP